jgi:hypothetical protein
MPLGTQTQKKNAQKTDDEEDGPPPLSAGVAAKQMGGERVCRELKEAAGT